MQQMNTSKKLYSTRNHNSILLSPKVISKEILLEAINERNSGIIIVPACGLQDKTYFEQTNLKWNDTGTFINKKKDPNTLRINVLGAQRNHAKIYLEQLKKSYKGRMPVISLQYAKINTYQLNPQLKLEQITLETECLFSNGNAIQLATISGHLEPSQLETQLESFLKDYYYTHKSNRN